MEIVTYVIKGAITHQDHLGNEGRTEAGQIQVMSAGNGIQHAEYNKEQDETELFQIWIMPNKQGVPARWETVEFPAEGRDGKLVPLASGRGHEGAIPLYADGALYAGKLKAGETHPPEARRQAGLPRARQGQDRGAGRRRQAGDRQRARRRRRGRRGRDHAHAPARMQRLCWSKPTELIRQLISLGTGRGDSSPPSQSGKEHDMAYKGFDLDGQGGAGDRRQRRHRPRHGRRAGRGRRRCLHLGHQPEEDRSRRRQAQAPRPQGPYPARRCRRREAGRRTPSPRPSR